MAFVELETEVALPREPVVPEALPAAFFEYFRIEVASER